MTSTASRAPAKSGDRNFYRFRSEWQFDASPQAVYTALEHFENYPRWWPEVRTIRLFDPESCEVTCRSVLPYDLTFVMRPLRRDPAAGVLEASMTGDLEGFARWTIGLEPAGTSLVFEEEVSAHKRLLRLLSPMARPVFRGNHAVMMNHARAGIALLLQPGRADQSLAGVTA